MVIILFDKSQKQLEIKAFQTYSPSTLDINTTLSTCRETMPLMSTVSHF